MKIVNKAQYIQGCLGLLVVAMVFVGLPLLSYVRASWNVHEKVITVNKCERVMSKNSSKYLVFTTEGDVYAVADSTWWWTFDSSDRYAIIEKGGRYRVTVYGWRWRFFSSYQNLIKVERAEE